MRHVIIVLSEQSEEDCVQQMRTAFDVETEGFDLYLTDVRIIFVEGTPSEPDALRRVSLHSARYVAILGE